MIRKLLITFTILFCLAVVGAVAAGGYVGWFFYRAMPPYEGSLALPGLSAPVHVVHDEHGVPHIFADNMNDAARALGYIHAGERLFQMEMQRRAGQGRLSEILGPDMLDVDKFIRTLGLYDLAQSSVDSLSPDTQKFIQAYADGVNTWLNTHQNALPPEFLLLKFKPRPWKPEDSIVWSKLMALQLSKNYKLEILRAQLAKKLSPAQMNALFLPQPGWAPVTVKPNQGSGVGGQRSENESKTSVTSAQADAMPLSNTIADRLASVTGLGHPASNEWVISGSRTKSGKPILANDPHLGLEAPILWYLARIVTPDLAIEGATVPGLPVVLLGQNGHVAWGFTTTGSDTEDLFIETIDPKKPDYYLTPGGEERFKVRTETIHVKGAKDVTMEVRTTRHGPVLSDIEPDLLEIAGMNKVVALAFTGLGPHDATSEALIHANRAKNAAEFLDALHLYEAPTQNVVYADTSGTIGFINPGYVPIRKSGDGTVPSDGASGDHDWIGAVPFDQLPQTLNPKAGFIFNANNAVVTPQFPHFLGVDWEEPWRAYRIQQFLDAIDKQTLDSSAMMQADHMSLAARALLPWLLAQKPATPRASEALGMLRGWDGTMNKDKPEPLIFEAWLYEMHQNLLVAKTRSPLTEKGPYDALSIDFIIEGNGKDWCKTRDCGDVVIQSFNDALNLLTRRDGPDMKKWRWGDEHYAVLKNKFYSHVPVLRDWTRLDIASSGDFYTLDRGGSGDPPPDHPFIRDHGGGYRGIYDLADPDKSRFMIATGESGHIFSPHYGDLVRLWNDVKYFTLSGTHDELVARGLPDLVLRPQ